MTAKLGADTAGQPTPAPFRFCNVTSMVVARCLLVAALWSLASLLNWTFSPCTLPAATFLLSAARNDARDGGQEQGMLTTELLAALKPSHEPCCRAFAFTFCATPKSGTRLGLMFPVEPPPPVVEFDDPWFDDPWAALFVVPLPVHVEAEELP